MCKWGTDRTITIKRQITVDACIADEITALNDAGIYTTASCCGHGQETSGPGGFINPNAAILPSSTERARKLGYEVHPHPEGGWGYPYIVLNGPLALQREAALKLVQEAK